MRKTRKRLIAGAAAIAALGGGGAAIAASQLGATQESQAIVADAAQRLGVSEEQLSTALEDATEARVDQAVTDGRLTQEQADELKQRIESGEVPLVGAPLGGPGDHHRGGPGGGMHAGLEAAATYLGLDESALREQLRGGQTLAAVATAQGKTVDGLTQAMQAAIEADLAQAVTDGRLTQEQADARQAELAARLDQVVNEVLPARPEGGRGPGGHGPRGAWGDQAAPDGAAPAAPDGTTQPPATTTPEDSTQPPAATQPQDDSAFGSGAVAPNDVQAPAAGPSTHAS